MLNYQYFRDHYQLITVNFRKQVELDADPRAIQQIEFNGIRKTNAQVCTIFFNAEIQERKIMSKKLSIYIATFDYFDNTLIVLSATRGGVSITSFASIFGAPVGIASANCSLIFTLTREIIKKK